MKNFTLFAALEEAVAQAVHYAGTNIMGRIRHGSYNRGGVCPESNAAAAGNLVYDPTSAVRRSERPESRGKPKAFRRRTEVWR